MDELSVGAAPCVADGVPRNSATPLGCRFDPLNGHLVEIAGRKREGVPYWRLVVPLPPDPVTHKRRQLVRGYRGTRKQAQQALRKLVGEVETGKHSALRTTVAELCAEWVKMKRKKWSPTTAARAEDVLRIHVLPTLGALPLAKLDSYKIDRLYDDLLASGLAPPTVRKVHSVLHAALQQAVKWRWLATNPADTDFVSPPEVPAPEVTVPSVEQVHRLMAAAEAHNPDVGCFARLAAATGARRGELCGLRWSDFEFHDDEAYVDGGANSNSSENAGSMLIARAVVRDDDQPGRVTVRQPKTEQSVRRLKLDPATVLDVVAQMERVAARAAGAGVSLVDDPYLFGSGYVYTAGNLRAGVRLDGGVPWHPLYPTKVWQRIRATAGLPQVQMRTLRHFTATQLLGAGVDIKTVQRRLGHARAAVTLDTYGRAMPGTDGAAAEHMGRLLERQIGPGGADTPTGA
jgi:integrase